MIDPSFYLITRYIVLKFMSYKNENPYYLWLAIFGGSSVV